QKHRHCWRAVWRKARRGRGSSRRRQWPETAILLQIASLGLPYVERWGNGGNLEASRGSPCVRQKIFQWGSDNQPAVAPAGDSIAQSASTAAASAVAAAASAAASLRLLLAGAATSEP